MFARNLIKFCTFLVCTLIFSFAVQAHEYKAGDIEIDHPFARSTVPGQRSGSAYLTIKNEGKVKDELVKAESTMTKSVELHTMEMKNGVMKMREVDDIGIDAGKIIKMQPGHGYHLMLMGLKQQLQAGDKFPLTLYFKNAGKIDVVLNVEANVASDHQH